MKYAVIHQKNDEGLPSSRLLCLLEVSKSSYYAWLKRKPSKRDIANNALREQIARVYWQHQGRYGYIVVSMKNYLSRLTTKYLVSEFVDK